MIFAADIGGTKTTLALFDWKDERVDPVREQTFLSNDFESFEAIVTEFLTPSSMDLDEEHTPTEEEETDSELPKQEAQQEMPPIEAACFGVAGPILENRCKTTNLPWSLDGNAHGSACTDLFPNEST